MSKILTGLLLVISIIFSGCVQQTSQQSSEQSSELLTGTVVKVIDGDTVSVKISQKEEKVRLIGIDTPETHHPAKPVEPYGPQAENYTRSKLTGNTVFLEVDVSERDRYGRLLAYVWLSPPSSVTDSEIRAKMFNAQLLLNGYAQILTVPPNVRYIDYFTTYQREARNSARGLWGLVPAPVPTPAQVPSPAPAQAHPDLKGVVIESIDLVEEVVVIKNNGSNNVNMTGWKLVSETGNQTYFFPDDFILGAGAKVVITSGPKAFEKQPSDLTWTNKFIWNNGGDTGVLYDESGNRISEK